MDTRTKAAERKVNEQLTKTSPPMKFAIGSNRDRNRMWKMKNGNGKMRQNLTVIHWNMGGKLWENKLLEIEMVKMEFDPDIQIVSEANMKLSLTEMERQVPGYYMILPKTIELQNHARLVMLVREGLEVKTLNELMDNQLAAVWIRVSSRGRKSMTIGAVYREHQLIWQEEENDSGSAQCQNERWNRLIDQWKRAARDSDVMVIGDLNLNHLKWGNPDQIQVRMIEKVKN